jgi:hypothetical protein
MIAMTSETIEQPTSAFRRRGCLFYLKRGLVGLLMLLVGIPVVGMIYQAAAEASDRQAYPPPGQMAEGRWTYDAPPLYGRGWPDHCPGSRGIQFFIRMVLGAAAAKRPFEKSKYAIN